MKSVIIAFLRWLYKKGLNKTEIPDTGEVILGDFNRTSPFSEEFGYDRGGPIDRYYIENFLEKNEALIHGRVLEIGDNEYTLRFGKSRVAQSDIFDIDSDNSKATIIGDLSNASNISDNNFDCIILTQTLHMIYNYSDALATCFRILKQNGTLLLTVPGITNIDYNDEKNSWMFSFTKGSIQKALTDIFPTERIQVETYGNVLTATAFLYGMGLPELPKHQVDFTDPHYQVIISAIATKPA
jgi:SAM-dependent methyltransferase